MLILLAGSVLFVYAQTLGFDFVRLDDGDYVTENPWVRAGLSFDGFSWAMRAQHSSNWHPLTWLSHMLDVELFGLDPAGHHATNVLLHAINTGLVFGLFLILSGQVGASGLVAALFAVHPLHVESVAWVSERKDLLSTCFALLAMLAYVAYARRGGYRRYALLSALFALSLLAKPTWVTLPFVLLLLDWWPLQRLSLPGPWSGPGDDARLGLGRALFEKLPLMILMLISCGITLQVQSVGDALVFGDGLPRDLPVVGNAVVSYARYLAKAVWPVQLAVLYPHPGMASEGGVPLEIWQIGAAGCLLLGLSAWALWPRAPRYRAVGWLWYLGTLVPMIGLVQVGRQAMADRYTYIPLIGIFVLVVFGGLRQLERWRLRRPRLAVGATVLAAGVVLTYATAARVQAEHWRNSVALFEHTLRVTPRNPTIRYNLGNTFKSQGRIDEAIVQYRRALETKPEASEVHYNLANALRGLGRADEAIQHYEQAILSEPGYAKAHYNLANLLREAGRLEEAIRHYRLALEAQPNLTNARHNLARAQAQRSREGRGRGRGDPRDAAQATESTSR